MQIIHHHLCKKSPLYHKWHQHPYHQHHHWLVFLLAFLLSSYAVAAGWTTTVQELSILNIPSFAPAPAHAQTQSRFFQQHSTWYEKIPPNPAITPNSANYVSDILTNSSSLAVNNTIWSHTIWYADATTPLTDVILTHQRNFKYDFIIDNGWDKNIPIPLNAQPPGAFDDHVVVVSPDKDYAWDFNRFENRGNGVFAADLVFGWDLNGDGIDCPPLGEGPPWNNATLGRSPRVADTPLSHGIITREEIERGYIDHAVAFAYWGSAEGRGVYPSCIVNAPLNPRPWALKLGMRLQLDPNLDINSLGLNRAGKIIAKALQEYGMIFVENDGIGSNSVYAESFTGKSISWNDPGPDGQPLLRPSDALPIPLNQFRVIDPLMPSFAGDPPSSCTRYVATTGADANSGTEAQPWKTVQKAADSVVPGDVVCVKDGVYTDTNNDGIIVRINRGGTADNWIIFRSENKWGAVLDGQNNKTEFCVLFYDQAQYIRLENFEIKGCGGTGIVSNREGVNHIYIYANHIHHIGVEIENSIYGQNGVFQGIGTSYHTYDSNVFHDIGRINFDQRDHGIYLDGTKNNVIINNIFYNLTSDAAISPTGRGPGLSNLKIMNNTIFTRPRKNKGQIWLAYPCDNVTIQNNIFYEPGDFAISFSPDDGSGITNLDIRNNLFYGTSKFDIVMAYTDQVTLSNNILNLNPLFVDLDSYNFSLQSNSPAIDAGTSQNAPSTDFEGTPRPQGSAWDIGADELGAGTTGPVCGLNGCEVGETPQSCPQDCGTANQPPRNLRLRYLGPTP